MYKINKDICGKPMNYYQLYSQNCVSMFTILNKKHTLTLTLHSRAL